MVNDSVRRLLLDCRSVFIFQNFTFSTLDFKEFTRKNLDDLNLLKLLDQSQVHTISSLSFCFTYKGKFNANSEDHYWHATLLLL